MLNPMLEIKTTAAIADNLTSSSNIAPKSCVKTNIALRTTRRAADSDWRKIMVKMNVTKIEPPKAMKIKRSKLKYCAQ